MSIRLVVPALFLVLGLASLEPLAGQGGRGQVRRAPEWVQVEPFESGPEYIDYSISTSRDFLVTSQYPYGTATIDFTCGSLGIVVSCSTSIPTVDLEYGDTVTVTVSFTTGSSGRTGQAVLYADGPSSTEGTYLFDRGTLSKPTMTRPRQPDSLVSRALCTTAGAGVAAASCGEALLTLTTPTVTTLDRARGLTLGFTSSAASPHPWAMAQVTIADDNPPLTHITVQLTVRDTVRRSVRYFPWTGTRQVVVGWQAEGYPTGAYPYRLTTRTVMSGDSLADSVSGVLFVVNRSASPYGQGMEWLGVERLVFNQPVGTADSAIMWVGGDGSAALYRRVNGTTWVAPPAAFRDTITYAGGEYTRHLQHGAQVIYDATGRHLRTVTRAQQTTHFYWRSATALDSVRVPPSGSGGQTIRLLYHPMSGLLDSVQVGTGAGVGVAQSAGRMTQWRWPDGTSLAFTYDSAGRVITAADDRGGKTLLDYGNHGLLTQARVLLHASDTAKTLIDPWQAAGYTIGTGWQTAGDTADAVIWLTGPMGERTRIGVDRWLAPIAVTDPIGVTTTYHRTNATVPALVTAVHYPNARRAFMTYNARGNLTSLTDSTWGTRAFPKQVTTWTYGDPSAPDSPTAMSTPGNGTTTWTYGSYQLPVSITDGRGLTTTFAIETDDSTRGQIRTATDHDVRTWVQGSGTTTLVDLVTTWHYDASGNTRAVTSPTGGIDKYTRDARGRITRADDAVGLRTDLAYNAVDQVITSTIKSTLGDTTSTCLSTNFVCAMGSSVILDALNPAGGDATSTATYTSGYLTQVADPRSVLQGYRYDLAGRMIAQLDEAGAKDSAVYNRNGQVTRVQDRLGLLLDTWYDQGGRDTLRRIPRRPATFRGVVVDSSLADTIRTTWDSLGNVLSVRNRSGTIRRGYYENGALRYEVTVPINLKLIDDSVSYSYDTGGRLRRITWANSDSVVYSYHSSGDLATLHAWIRTNGSPIHAEWSFIWDQLGRRDSIAYPGGLGVRYAYDRAGTLRQVVSNSTSGISPPNRFNFTFAQDSVDVLGRPLRQTMNCYGQSGFGSPCGQWLPETTRWRYNRWGHLVYLEQPQSPIVVDSMYYDRSGNRIRIRGFTKITQFYFPSGSNRLATDSTANVPLPTVFSGRNYGYAADGAQVRRWRGVGTDSADYAWQYDALGRLAGRGRFLASGGYSASDTAWNRCHWDGESRASLPCDEGSQIGYVGNNATRTSAGWFFIHAPGIDESLLMVYRYPNLSWQVEAVLQVVTDGRGQVLAVADTTGWVDSTAAWWGAGFGMGQWKSAGLTSRAQTFEPRRWETGEMWGDVQQFRHRAYDPSTGRWLQEDPIGVAGGLNLYQYNGNNPATFRDPFGLCPIPPSDCRPGYFTALGLASGAVIGAATGGTAGGGLGGLGGLILGAPTGPGALATAAAGGTAGAAAGSAAGGVIGGAIGAGIGSVIDMTIMFAKSWDIRQVDQAIRKAIGRKPSDEERRKLSEQFHKDKAHDRLGRDYDSFGELVDYFKSIWTGS